MTRKVVDELLRLRLVGAVCGLALLGACGKKRDDVPSPTATPGKPNEPAAVDSLRRRNVAGTDTGSPRPMPTFAEAARLSKLSRAIVSGDLVTLREHLAAGGSPDVNTSGTTLLMEAVNVKKLEPARLLVEAGANVNAIDHLGRTPLHYALDDLQIPGEPPHDPKAVMAVVQLLVDHGAKVDPEVRELDNLPLAQAAMRGDRELVTYLIAKGASPKRKDAQGRTALIAAINAGDATITKLLIDNGAPIDVEKAGPGAAPLLHAIAQGSIAIEMARYQKKDPKTVSGLVNQWLAVINVVIQNGANLEARDYIGWSALETAINGGVPEILRRVLDTKPKLDTVDGKGRQPLHFLAALGRLEEPELLPLAKLLIARGANKKAKTLQGETAADIASNRGFARLAKALR